MSDLLPPGNMPSPNAAGDDTKDFPDFWASDMWPALWPATIRRYATTVLRDADLAGLGASDRAFAYCDNIDAITRWNGTAWVYMHSYAVSAIVMGGFSAGSHAPGSGAVHATLTFPAGRFSIPPVVQVSLATIPANTAYLEPRYDSVTAASCEIYIYNQGPSTVAYSGLSVAVTATQVFRNSNS